MDPQLLPPLSVPFWQYAFGFVTALSVVVFFHELGHYLVGRWNGVKAEAFSIGFGPELFGFTDRLGTRWKFSAIPLGGYVKFFGDANAASLPDGEANDNLSEEEKSWSLPHKSVGQRAAVVAAGPIANFILAIVIFAAIFMTVGRTVSLPVISEVLPGSAAEEAGLQKGDLIVAIDGSEIESFNEVPLYVVPSAGKTLSFAIRRGGNLLELPVTPQEIQQQDRFGNNRIIGRIGVSNGREEGQWRTERSGPIEALRLAVKQSWLVVTTTLTFIKDIIMGYRNLDMIGGPVAIAQAAGQASSLGFVELLMLTGYLSVGIGLLNLFPIPVLDGGHLVFYAIEAIRRRPLNQRTQEIGFGIGFAILMTLMVIITVKDINQIIVPAMMSWFS